MKFFTACVTGILLAISVCGQQKTLSLQYIDSSVKPGNDFYMYANGKWYDTATILPTESRAGARLEMDYLTKANIKSILEQSASAKNKLATIEQKVGDFYTSGMDTVTINKLGYQPVKKYLAQISALKNEQDVMRFAAEQTTYSNQLLIGLYVGADEKNSAVSLPIFYQAGLGLPDRDYYFKDDAATQTVVKAYQDYVIKLFMLTGDDAAAAAKKMTTVYAFEKQMAAAHRTNVELRDPQTNYNKMAVADLVKQMPAIGWKVLLANLRINADSINIGQPGYYYKLDTLLKSVPVDTWKLYLHYHLLDNTAFILSNDFVMANFNYTGKALSGQQQIKPRWERVYDVIDGVLGEALGELYVQKYFTPAAKQRITILVSNLQKAFDMRLNNLDWMSDSTRQVAKQKLATFIKKVGYPDKWKDYSKVTISRKSYFDNIMTCGKNEYDHQVNKIGKPVDRTEWGMTPPTNNAYYNPTFNEIVFPAGILSYPMFDVNADDA